MRSKDNTLEILVLQIIVDTNHDPVQKLNDTNSEAIEKLDYLIIIAILAISMDIKHDPI